MWIACRESVPQNVKLTMHLDEIDFSRADHVNIEKALERLAIDAGFAAKCEHGGAYVGWKTLDIALTD